MTDATLPAAHPRRVLTQIAPVSWEHPADRAALQTLRSVPGFDEVVKKIVGFFGERGIRLLFQANAVRVGPTQFPKLHQLYTTILVTIVFVSANMLPFLAGLFLAPIRFALMEWFRKSELSSDRAGLIASQDPNASMRMFLKMAGGGDMKEMDLNTFLAQAKEYEESGGAVDRIFKILNTLDQSHPFNTLRAAELQRWIEAGVYDSILRGEYTRRGPDAENRPIDKDIDEASAHYMKEAKAVVNDVVDTAKRAAQAFTDAFKKR